MLSTILLKCLGFSQNSGLTLHVLVSRLTEIGAAVSTYFNYVTVCQYESTLNINAK